MKTLQRLLFVLLLHSKAFSQVPLGYFFPMGVMGITYGDTLLNTSAVLKAAGVRKITSIQTSKSDLKTGFSPITTYLNANSKIEKVVYCLRTLPKTDSSIFLEDTILYDSEGRMLQCISRDASGLPYLRLEVDYSLHGKVKYTLISSIRQQKNDTSISYHYYNEGGQLVRLVSGYGSQTKLTPLFSASACVSTSRVRLKSGYGSQTKLTPLSATVYYNADGLPDSIRDDNKDIETYIFKRRQKGNNKEILLETTTHYFMWVYNASGQCTSSEMGLKKRHTTSRNNNRDYYTQSSATYKYNHDGTLAKVLIKRDRKKLAGLSYSYEK
jgi:hypothetical protein